MRLYKRGNLNRNALISCLNLSIPFKLQHKYDYLFGFEIELIARIMPSKMNSLDSDRIEIYFKWPTAIGKTASERKRIRGVSFATALIES